MGKNSAVMVVFHVAFTFEAATRGVKIQPEGQDVFCGFKI